MRLLKVKAALPKSFNIRKSINLLPKKSQTIKNLPVPKTPKEVRQMLGWTG